MNLRSFLCSIDNLTGSASAEQMATFIHEHARLLKDAERSAYLELLQNICGTSSDSTLAQNTDHQDLSDRFNKISDQLQQIYDGELSLTAELNEEYDDWYDNYDEEFIYRDPSGIGAILDGACEFAVDCLDYEQYEYAADIITAIICLELPVAGEWSDYCESLDASELKQYGIITFDYRHLVSIGMYAVYCSSDLDNRAEELFTFMDSTTVEDLGLEEILQGRHEPEDFTEFLPLWIEYLGTRGGWRTRGLLKEALNLNNDTEAQLNYARRFCSSHPSIYKDYFDENGHFLDPGDLQLLGTEALQAIAPQYEIRSSIAGKVGWLARNCGCTEFADDCLLEAFRSRTSVLNYLRLYAECADFSMYAAETHKIIHAAYSAVDSKNNCPSVSEELTENRPTRNTLYLLLFLSREFKLVKEEGMNVNYALGWTSTFMKCGIAAFLLLLFKGDHPDKGCRRMCSEISSSSGLEYNNSKLYIPEGFNLPGQEWFWNCFCKWKSEQSLSFREQEDYFQWLEGLIDRRVTVIMDGNKRSYYDECAAFLAAYGEAAESVGRIPSRQAILLRYKERYSRRRAFHESLRAYGMKDSKRK